MSDEFKYDVFLSHNHADKPRVRKLAERLKAAGVRVWLDEWVIQAGDIIALKVDEGLEQSRVLLLCISPAALASGWVALERSTAVHRDPTNEGRRFIPLLLDDCELPDTIRRYKYVDFREDSETSFAEIMAACPPGRSNAHALFQKELEDTPRDNEIHQSETHRELSQDLELKIEAHEKKISSLVVSRDGTWVASGSSDKTVKLWSLATAESFGSTKKGHCGAVNSISLSADGSQILVGSQDFAIRVWNSDLNGECCLINVDGPVLFAQLSEDGKRILFGQLVPAGGLEIWKFDFHQMDWISPFRHAKDFTQERKVRFPHAEYLRHSLSDSNEFEIKIRDFETGFCIANLVGHSKRVLFVHLSDNGKVAISISDDRTIKIWDIPSSRCRATIECGSGALPSISISPDGELISIASAQSNTVSVWDLAVVNCVRVIFCDPGCTPSSSAFSPDNSRLLIGTCEGFIFVVRLGDRKTQSLNHSVRRYLNAKVVLLGEGTVGKTSLAHRLVEDRYVIQDRTHGMNVWRLELPLQPDDTIEREVLLWDLAGQEDQRLIHKLFLEQTALALLLINPQKDDPFLEAGEWLRALNTTLIDPATKREPPRLLIFSQIDAGGMKLGDAKIDRFREQYGFAAWLPTSAKTGKNCSDGVNGGQPSKLKQLIAESIPWDDLPWSSTPRLLAELKTAVMAMRDESDIRLLRFSELAQRLEQALPEENFTEPDVRTAVTLLANHGLARPLKFGDLVLLRPDLINGYAGAVIRAARAHTDEIGCVLEADIYRPDFDFTGVERLKHRPDEELLLRALVQTFLDHSLCIAEETPHGRHLVFPSQYRREKDIPHEPDIFVSYTFSGEWQTVWTTLVVRLWYSQEFEHRELWRNAAEFESARKQTLGLKITKTGDGAATISLYFDHGVPDELRVIFIEYVHCHLAKFACEVTRDRRYVCPECGKPVKDLDAVRLRLEAKKDFITCQECDEKVPFVDFIEQRLNSDPVARKILAMDETATRQLDTQSLEQILIGHMMAIAGEANQIFRPVTMFDHGIDGEVEFKDNDGKASGKRIYIQLKSGNSYLRIRKGDGSEVFDVKDDRHLDYWINQPVDVYLVIRQTDELSGQQIIRWMNVTRYLKGRTDKESRQIIFTGEKLDMEAVWKVRDGFFPIAKSRK